MKLISLFRQAGSSERWIESLSGEVNQKVIRCDNGPEYISHLLAAWAEKNEITLKFIQPGNPQQNAYIERYNRTVRYDWLEQFLWKEIGEVQDYATKWLWHYNHQRPNMALGGFTPKQKLAMAV